MKKEIKISRPEEVIRQKVLYFLIHALKFPEKLIATEKKIESFLNSGLPCPLKRRFDILCFSKSKEEVNPLLLIECKADKIVSKNFEQVEGYNSWIGAKFVALVAKNQAFIGKFCKKDKRYVYQEGLLSYDDLLGIIKNELD